VLQGSFQDIFRGDFEGIGAHVNMNRQGKLLIVSPIPGGPAEAAGIRPGDIILEVDGEDIEGMSLLEAVSLIRGPKGSTVTLLLKHLGALDPITLEIKRGVIPLVSVILRSEPGERFAHIRITNFYPNTAEALKETLLQAIEDGAEGLILDVRDNDGGTLDAVVDIASMFLDLDDDLVLYVLKGDGTRTNWRVRDVGIAKGLPMVLLVNERSASSSEVLAGALQDHDRATVIGANTFGKGSVNILRPLSNGGGLYITIAYWYTPLGRIIQTDGLKPDIEVENRDPREADVQQLRRAIEELEQMSAATSS
jgi:carboxyl-terminal processing protease